MSKFDYSSNVPQLYVRWKDDLLRRPYHPRRRPLPAPQVGILDDPTECITINAEWFSHLLGVMSALTQEDSWDGDDDERYRALQEIEKLIASIKPCEPCAPTSGGGGGGGSLLLPDCVEALDTDGDGVIDVINIDQREGDCMVVNIYQNCGCGCGGSSGAGTGGTGGTGAGTDGTGGNVGSGFPGDTYGSDLAPSKCDVASYILDYVLTQASEWFDAFDNYLDSGGNIADWFEESSSVIDKTDVTPALVSSIKTVIEGAGGGVEQIRDMLTDTDFRLKFQESWWRATSEDGALTGSITELTRADLKRGNRYISIFWGNALDGIVVLPRVVLDIFFSIINMGKVNNRLALASGQANETLCQYLAAQIGEEYQPSVTPGSVILPAAGVCEEADFTLGTGGWVSVSENAGGGVGTFYAGTFLNEHVPGSGWAAAYRTESAGSNTNPGITIEGQISASATQSIILHRATLSNTSGINLAVRIDFRANGLEWGDPSGNSVILSHDAVDDVYESGTVVDLSLYDAMRVIVTQANPWDNNSFALTSLELTCSG